MPRDPACFPSDGEKSGVIPGQGGQEIHSHAEKVTADQGSGYRTSCCWTVASDDAWKQPVRRQVIHGIEAGRKKGDLLSGLSFLSAMRGDRTRRRRCKRRTTWTTMSGQRERESTCTPPAPKFLPLASYHPSSHWHKQQNKHLFRSQQTEAAVVTHTGVAVTRERVALELHR